MTTLWGTSTWTYPGWDGLVYRNVKGYGKRFNRECLREYAANERFGFATVGIDNTFYRAADRALLLSYAAQLPDGFQWVMKAPQVFTAPFFTAHFRGPRGETSGPNPAFLDPSEFSASVLGPLADFRPQTGAVVLEIPLVPPSVLPPEEAYARIDSFLFALPKGWPLAFEIRSRWWLSNGWFDLLARHRAAHAFQVWTHMPLPDALLAQYPQALDCADFAVLRALVAPGTPYADAVERFAPYDRLQQIDPKIRAAIVKLVREAEARDRKLLALINNRLEGCAPLTIEGLRAQLAHFGA